MDFSGWLHKDKPAMPIGLPANAIPIGALSIPLSGSLQNASWSPDGMKLVFTEFLGGYNEGPASIFIYDLMTFGLDCIVKTPFDNVTQPGSTWNQVTGRILFSSDCDGHDEVWSIKPHEVAAKKMTSRTDQKAFEPSYSPDGKQIVFESHVGEAERGQVVILTGDREYRYITDSDDDARQPNWSPKGDVILYQIRKRGRWEIYTYNVATQLHTDVTSHFSGDKTDATFSPDGLLILFSGERADGHDGLKVLYLVDRNVSDIKQGSGYYGAASWSPDGRYIVAETSKSDPDGGPGTKLEILRAR